MVTERVARSSGRLLISDTLPRLDRIVPRPQVAAVAVTHYSRDIDGLGDRSEMTRELSADSD